MRYLHLLPWLYALACTSEEVDAEPGDILVRRDAYCFYTHPDGPLQMQAGAPHELQVELTGVDDSIDGPADYDNVGWPYPAFTIAVAWVPVVDGAPLPALGRLWTPPDLPWTEAPLRVLDNDSSFHRAFDVSPPGAGSWVLYAKSEVPGVTDRPHLCRTPWATTGWAPDPPVAGWEPYYMIWVDAA